MRLICLDLYADGLVLFSSFFSWIFSRHMQRILCLTELNIKTGYGYIPLDFYNGCITKQCFLTQEISYNDIVKHLHYDNWIKLKKCSFFVIFWYFYEGKACKSKIRVVMPPLQNLLFCSSTSTNWKSGFLHDFLSLFVIYNSFMYHLERNARVTFWLKLKSEMLQ